MIFAVGDLGGTNLRLAIVKSEGGQFLIEKQKNFKTADYPDLASALDAYSQELGLHFDVISLGVAGPVVDGRVKLTNLSWSICIPEIVDQMDCHSAFLINDLEAYAYGLPWVDSEDMQQLNRTKSRSLGNQCLIAVGTGLGEAQIVWDGARFIPFATEGGHTGFSPSDQEELEILAQEMKKYPVVSWERLLSGAYGFGALLSFYGKLPEYSKEAELFNGLPQSELGPSIVASYLSGGKLASRILKRFARFYGSEAGNLCLKALARGGVFVAGSIAQELLRGELLEEFLHAFQNKGRFEDMLKEIPIFLVKDDSCALKGAYRFARMNLKAHSVYQGITPSLIPEGDKSSHLAL